MKKIKGLLSAVIFLLFFSVVYVFAQTPDELEIDLDFNSPAVILPKIFKANIDLSGMGKHRDATFPQVLAAQEVLDSWATDLGWNNFYRLQYNLWEIDELAKDPAAQAKLLDNYEGVIKKINQAGGIIILDLFGTPSGLGRVWDKNSPPHNLKIYKTLVKDIIRKLSVEKKYNIWYEVWNAPDLADFFLGERSEYFNLYRAVGEAVNELRAETKIVIPLGGPAVSCWFGNIEPNNILTPEKSLIYELIKYCDSYHLPLDFISWHAYSTDPQEEKQETIYNKSFVKLLREWLGYFRFDVHLPLIIDEWNFDAQANILAQRGKLANIAASFIPARIKNMYEAGIDNQIYFCLEDFGTARDQITRNLGAVGIDLGRLESKGYQKSIYNIFQMFNLLGSDLLTTKFNDEFVGVLATKSPDYCALLIYNYLDPQGALNYLSRNIVNLSIAERKTVLEIVKSERIKKILSGQLDIATLRLSPKVKALFTQALELNNQLNKFSGVNRKLKLTLKGLKEIYELKQYIVDSSCQRDCEFKEKLNKDVDFNQDYIENLEIAPYSVQLLVFKKKIVAPKIETPVISEEKKEVNKEVNKETSVNIEANVNKEALPVAKVESPVTSAAVIPESGPQLKTPASAEVPLKSTEDAKSK